MERSLSPGPENLRGMGRMTARSPTFVPRKASPCIDPPVHRSGAFTMSGEAAFDVAPKAPPPVASVPEVSPAIAAPAPMLRAMAPNRLKNHILEQHFIIGIVGDQLRMFLMGTVDERPDAAETLLEIISGGSTLQGWVLMHVASAVVCLPEVQAWLQVPGYNLEKVIVGYLAYCAYCA